jgi:UDP-N-acetylglucosamine 3-dehydrogenase
MSRYRLAVIGAGRTAGPKGDPGIAYHHAAGYKTVDQVEMVAVADIDLTNLQAFAGAFGVAGTYRDYREMLKLERPEIVTICTWPALHAEMAIACADAGARGILCEKPMALGLAQADAMLEACARSGTQLSICHQRRLSPSWTTAKAWLEAGLIGRLVRMDAWIENWDLLSYGTHYIDLFFYFTDDAPAVWVFAQIDRTGQLSRYGHAVEDRGLTMVELAGDVTALLHTAPEAHGIGMRLTGSEGTISIPEGSGPPTLIGARGAAPATPAQGVGGVAAAMIDLVSAIDGDYAPELGGRRGRAATEVIMAAYASGAERRLVSLPYSAGDFPLLRPEEGRHP